MKMEDPKEKPETIELSPVERVSGGSRVMFHRLVALTTLIIVLLLIGLGPMDFSGEKVRLDQSACHSLINVVNWLNGPVGKGLIILCFLGTLIGVSLKKICWKTAGPVITGITLLFFIAASLESIATLIGNEALVECVNNVRGSYIS
jgi:type IV secretory pathway VirB2 component (pilin)